LPKDEADVEQLQKELAEVRANKDQLDSLKRRLNDELNEVAEKLQRVEDSTKPSDAEKPRKKKGKKQPTIELKPAERKERIQSLSAAIDQLDNQIIPKLAEIQKEAFDNGLDVAGLEPQQQKATKLVEALNVSFKEVKVRSKQRYLSEINANRRKRVGNISDECTTVSVA
jgi:cobalamin biosynthesis Mg chelatase CobN